MAARDPARAKAFAKRHGIPHVHNTYQGACEPFSVCRGELTLCVVLELIDDPAVDVVYNPVSSRCCVYGMGRFGRFADVCVCGV